MQITEVRIKLMDESQERLQAFCSITLDGCFVVRDLKIINGTKGPFVAMPSRKLTDRCGRCSAKNCLRAVYCSQCGVKLPESRAARNHEGRSKLYADIAHPINTHCRELIQQQVLQAYAQEQVLAQQPGYVCRYDDFGEEEFDAREEWTEATVTREEIPGDAQRRIEPAGAHEGPHQRANSHTAAQRAGAGNDEESFGAGIL